MRFVISAIAVSMLAAGCELPGEPGPVPAPSPTPPKDITGSPPPAASSYLGTDMKPATTTETHSGSSAAILAVSKTYITESRWRHEDGGIRYVYTPQYVLTETSGRSGARFSTMEIAAPAVEPRESCFDVRLAAGATVQPSTIDGDSGCYLSDYVPNLHVRTPLSSLTVTLTFVDDEGTPGTLVVRFSTN